MSLRSYWQSKRPKPQPRVRTPRAAAVLLLLVLIAGFLPALTPQPAVRAAAPYFTYTTGPGGRPVITQTAYEPAEIWQIDMRSPEDFHIGPDGVLYIADTGNRRIVVIDGEEQRLIGEDILNRPTGVFVAHDRIYVADYGNSMVYVFAQDGELVQEIGRPEEPLFGVNTRFAPRKLVVDARSNIYVISEGSVNGVVQLNQTGNFTGYVGSNQARVTPLLILQRRFFTEAQLGQLFRNVPPSPTGLSIDGRGLVYTATYGAPPPDAIKKFNVAGQNIFAGDMSSGSNVVLDLATTAAGNVFAIDNNGMLLEYDTYGNLIFAFGGKASGLERFGVLGSPTAIEVDEDYNLYVLDAGKNVIQLYEPTDFADEIHQGLTLFREGLYVEGEEYWQNILRLNSSFTLAYQALANAYFKQGDNSEALRMFELAEDKNGYSDAFWEIRNDWLQENLATIIIIIAVVAILWAVLKRIHKKYGIFRPVRRVWDRFRSIKIVDQLFYMRYWLFHPQDATYEMKHHNKVTVLSATIIYVWVIILQVTDIYVKSYLFRSLSIYQAKLLNEILVVLVPLLLFIGSNYLVATIKDGEGRVKDIYRVTAYSLSPYALFMLPLQILTNVLTYNESFVYDFLNFVIIAWCLVLLVLSLMQAHNYSFREIVINLLLTLFTMVMLVLVFAIVYMLISQEFDFLQTIFEEVLIRARYR